MSAEHWLRCPLPRPRAEVRLLCLPHAGGSTSLYRAWPKLFPPQVEVLLVCPPGREHRLDDPFPADLLSLVRDLAVAVVPLLDRPWAVFGHSMGATVGHELVLQLLSRGHRAPVHLFASSRRAPQHYEHEGTMDLFGDEQLCAELVRLGGTDSALLELPELRELVLPAVRGDYRLLATHRTRPTGPVGCPVTAFIGDEDRRATTEGAPGWREWTTATFELVTFPGGHFYFSDRPQDVVEAVLRRLPLPSGYVVESAGPQRR